MAKARVHELAKEWGKTNKEIIDALKEAGVEAKSHMSSVEDKEVAAIKETFAPGASKASKTPETSEAPKAADEPTAQETGEQPKKKNVVHVFRPQNIKNSGRMGQNAGQNRSNATRPAAQSNQGQSRPGTTGQTQSNMAGQSRPSTAGQTQTNMAGQNQPSTAGQAQPNMAGENRPSTAGQAQSNMAGQNQPSAAGQTQSNAASQSQPSTQGQNRPGTTGQSQSNTAGQSRPATTGQTQSNMTGQNRPNSAGQTNPSNAGYNRQGNSGQNSTGQNRSNTTRQGTQGTYGQSRPNNGNYNRPAGAGQNRPNAGGQTRPYNNNNGANRPNNGGGNRPYQSAGGNRPGGGGQNRPYNNAGGNRPYNGGGRDDKKKDNAAKPVIDQKSQRGKGKQDHKKKDYNQGKGGKNNKILQAQEKAALLQKPQVKEEKKEEKIKQIILPAILTIKELAEKMKMQPSVIVKKLFLQGKVVTVNQEVDYETAEEIALEFEVLCEQEVVVDVIEELLKEDEEDTATMSKRPPVVCVMGHVDHGKTSLLDAIRDTNVIVREAGGITQHIGAYVADVKGEKITFLDTPGHEAFTAMRMRGASSTDIAILVVAADDGVMPQTIEAINHAKAADIEIVVAINKMDKPSANIEKVKQELMEYELIAEDWGGSTIFVPVSAHTGEGIPELLDMLLLTAEVLELKANPDRTARGLVIEGELDKGKGSVATVLVQKGTLRVGDAIAAGSAHGKVRAMMDDKGRRVKEAGPSVPVEILGLNGVPNAGEVFVSCKNDKEARAFAETFISQGRVNLLADTKAKLSLDDLFTRIKEGNLKELGIIVKADVQGSVEAIKQSLLKLSNDEVVVKIVHGGVGAINESDVNLASTSNAIIIGFNVKPDVTAKETADNEGVDMRLYSVIYNAIEDVEAAMKGLLDPIFEEKVLGHAEIRQIFKASGVGTIAGSYVLDGTFERGCSTRITREGATIFDGPLASLKRFKDDVKEVKTGYECGFVFEKFNDVKEGDLVEAYKMVEVPR